MNVSNSLAELVIRPRRLRRTAALRALVREHHLQREQLVLPAFVHEDLIEPREISSMPGVFQHPLEGRGSIVELAERCRSAGLGGIMLFGVPHGKDPVGSASSDPAGVLNRATRLVAGAVGDDLVVMTDLCLDEFTDHGHCGVLAADGSVDNDATLRSYADMAVAQAQAGSAILGLSGMMDGQVGFVRGALDAAGYSEVALLAYAAKYTSALYGPFREAVSSSLTGSRATYQQDPANATEALREIELDIAEGADLVMVKPAGTHLDVIAAARAISPVPVAAYQVSGEYSQIVAAAERGWIDRDQSVVESLLHLRRAGASVILTYFALEVALRLPERQYQ